MLWLAKCELVFLGLCAVGWVVCWLADAMLAQRDYRGLRATDAITQLLRDDDRRTRFRMVRENLGWASILSLAIVVSIYAIAVIGLSIR